MSAEQQQQMKDLIGEIPENSVSVTCSAPVNIAVIKYWGKKEWSAEQKAASKAAGRSLPLVPVNSSLSAAIDQGSMKSLTCIVASKSYEKDTMFLNGKEEDIEANPRMKDVIQALRARAQPLVVDGVTRIAKEDWSHYHLRIVSLNNFPTAAGLASSASGYACFTSTLATLYNVEESFPGELSTIARQGSGSACRSMYGGWVAWRMGNGQIDGKDSFAEVVAPASHWPEMRVLILVANSGRKETPSTTGMQRTVLTSQLLKHRADSIVPARMASMESHIKCRDFASFGELTMRDSNQFHATCLDTYPPIFYLNETSQAIIAAVHAYNTYKGETKLAYTFDAGPNAVLFMLERELEEVLGFLLNRFPHPLDSEGYLHDPMRLTSYAQKDGGAANAADASTPYLSRASIVTPPRTNPDLDQALNAINFSQTKVYRMIVSKVGEGPIVVDKKNTFKSQ